MVLRSIAKFILGAFVLSCVFDPADTLFGLKMPLFACIIGLAALKACAIDDLPLPRAATLITVCFITVPSLSVLGGMASGLVDASLGFAMLKGYLLVLLYPAILILKLDLLRNLVGTLLALSLVVVGTFIYLQIEPDFYMALYSFGNESGVVFPDRRSYASDNEYLQIYYVTSPMILVAIASFFSNAQARRISGGNWAPSALACAICLVAMLLAGTRNNLMTSLMVFTALTFAHSRRRSYLVIFSAIASIGFAGALSAYLTEFLNPNEYSNSMKLALIADYVNIFFNLEWFLFGQGLGADIFWLARGDYHHLSELTYLEMVRNFGLLGAGVIACVLISPFFPRLVGVHRTTEYNDLLWAYFFYLIACATNPNLFSSMGILIMVTLLSYNAVTRSRIESAN